MTSECSYSSISLSLSLKSFLSIIHHYSSYSLLPHYINFVFSGLILNVTPRLCLKQRKKFLLIFLFIETNNKEPIISERSYFSISLSLSLSLSHS